MLDPETLRKLFLQNGAQGGVATQPAEAPASGGASVSPANVMPAQMTPAAGQGGNAGDSPHLSLYQKLLLRDHGDVLGVNSGGLYDKSAQPQQQASRPLPLTPAFNPNARDEMMPRGLAPDSGATDGQQPSFGNFAIQPPEGLASFSHDVSAGAADSSNGRAPNLPPITGINFPAENLPPISPDIETSTNLGDIPTQLAPRAVPKVMVPPTPGSGGRPKEDDGVNSRRYEYVTAAMGDNGKIKRNWRDMLGTAIGNTAQAFANNPRGDWRGNLIGGIGGGVLSAAIDPAGTRERNFNTYMLPQIEADRQREYQTAQMEHQRRQAAIDEQAKLMGIQDTASKIQERGKPKFGANTKVIYNTGTGEIEKMLPQAVTHDWKQTRTGEWFDANDPKNVDLLKQGAPPASAQQRLTNLTPGSVALNSDGQVVYQNPTTEKADPHYVAGVEGALKRHSELKDKATAADAEFQVARAAFEKNPNNPEIQKRYHPALANREAAIQALNSHAQSVNQSYGDQLEGGIGQGGFGYVKRKAGARPAVSNGRANQSLVRNVNDLPKF